MKSITNIIGSSVGSIIGYLICLGLTANEISDLLLREMSTYCEKEIDLEAIFAIWDTLGMDTCTLFVDMFKSILQSKLKVGDITFVDFAKRTGYNFVVCGSNLTLATVEYFCVDNTPEMSVIDAIRISIALPLLISPVILNDMIYVDASLFNNFPIEYFNTNRPFKDTISLQIKVPRATFDVANLNILSYMRIIMDAMFERMNHKINAIGTTNLVVDINLHDDGYGFDTTTFKLKMCQKTMKSYIKTGYDSIKTKMMSVD